MELGDYTISQLLNRLTHIAPSHVLQALLIFCSVSIILIAALPEEARALLTDYGARSSPLSHKASTHVELPRKNWLVTIAGVATSFGQIPHRWFIHFYVLSVVSSLFWLQQYASSGVVMGSLLNLQHLNLGGTSHSTVLGQVYLAWSMMLIQGTRRLYEEAFVTRTSSSTMWVVHWLIGLVFYAAVNIAVWIDGASVLRSSTFTMASINEMPPIKTTIGVVLFVMASIFQNQCHRQLARLPKYSVPRGGMFRILVCPHYTCECLIYLGLAITAAPASEVVHSTLLSALIFVTTNLGVTANRTRSWYVSKFGGQSVADKWTLVPLVY